MKGSNLAIIIVFFSLFIRGEVIAQTEEKPQWAPRSEKYRNVRDELGRKQGLWKYYSFSRNLMYEVTFLNDVKHGPCIRHSPATGIVTEESNYFNGRRDGDYKKYNYNGTLIAEGQYTDGRRTGSWATYFPVNGEKRSEGSYDQGKQDGAWRYYSSKGKLTAEGEYKGGLREGTWVFYSGDGSQSQEKKFSKGKEVGVVSTNPSTKNNKNKNNKKTNQPNQQNQPTQENQPTNETPNNN
jgi:antitoxin component YwqK of YwqJK toxin-antitoxin module